MPKPRTAVPAPSDDPAYERPFACPVCLGRGWMDTAFYTRLPVTTTEPCRSCVGTGIVWRGAAS